MITCKFGGTAITPANLHLVKMIASAPSRRIIVVSAIGKSHPSDVKVTDLLISFAASGNEQAWQQVCVKYRAMALQNSIPADVDKLLFYARQKALQGYESCLSVGEELSARLVASYLHATYLPAEHFVIFNERGKVNFAETYRRISAEVTPSTNTKLVTGGFYGSDLCGNRHVFSRGGGDVSGALFAVGSDSALYENWTDVCGVFVANPDIVPNARHLPCLSYAQMQRLSRLGATVLHHSALSPLAKCALPLVVGNFYRPYGPKTTVTNAPSSSSVLSVTEHKHACGFVTQVVHQMPYAHLSACLFRLDSLLPKGTAITKVTLSPFSVKIFTSTPCLQQIYQCFCPD